MVSVREGIKPACHVLRQLSNDACGSDGGAMLRAASREPASVSSSDYCCTTRKQAFSQVILAHPTRKGRQTAFLPGPTLSSTPRTGNSVSAMRHE